MLGVHPKLRVSELHQAQTLVLGYLELADLDGGGSNVQS